MCFSSSRVMPFHPTLMCGYGGSRESIAVGAGWRCWSKCARWLVEPASSCPWWFTVSLIPKVQDQSPSRQKYTSHPPLKMSPKYLRRGWHMLAPSFSAAQSVGEIRRLVLAQSYAQRRIKWCWTNMAWAKQLIQTVDQLIRYDAATWLRKTMELRAQSLAGPNMIRTVDQWIRFNFKTWWG